jgi:hypothetical protein
MEPLLIQIPKKTEKKVIDEVVSKIDFGDLSPSQLQVIEYPKLFIVDGIPTKEHREAISNKLKEFDIGHF